MSAAEISRSMEKKVLFGRLIGFVVLRNDSNIRFGFQSDETCRQDSWGANMGRHAPAGSADVFEAAGVSEE